jgi:hypothetical protein
LFFVFKIFYHFSFQPALQKSRIKEITTENVLSKLPKFARSKQSDAKGVVDSLLKAMNYSLYVANLEVRACKWY